MLSNEQSEEKVKLNLGGGEIQIDGYINVDRHVGKEVYPLEYPDNSVDEIRASHILEHFSYHDTVKVLENWLSKLKPGGIIKLSVPDFKKICDQYQKQHDSPINGYVMGGQVDQDDFHRAIFDEFSATQLLRAVGFVDVAPWESDNLDTCKHPVSLNIRAMKPISGIVMARKKISFAMSTPRLTFTENAKCLLGVLLRVPAQVEWGEGAYWSQVLTRTLTTCMDHGSDYIFTTDYDSWYTADHVNKMLSLMETHPEYDVLVPLQVRRESEQILLGMDRTKDGVTRLTKEDFAQDILPLLTGHFGLTLFRPSALKKLKKPWFLPIPDPNGDWGDLRRDEDVYFWYNCRDCGLKVGVAHEVKIGHMQLICTFPDTEQNNWKPLHVPISDVRAGKLPAHCIP
jgi:hypothetical protein